MTRRAALFIMAAGIVSLAALPGCRHAMNTPVPARLADTEPATMAALRAHLAEAMGEAKVELGASHPDRTGDVIVLPRRLAPVEDRSLAQPIRFDLELRGQTCFAVRRDTGEEVRLDGVDCQPID